MYKRQVHTKKKPLAPDVSLRVIAQRTAGFAGADLENLVNEAALLAARRNRKAITMEDIEEASMKVMAGPEKKSRVVTPEEKKLTAYHEAGHAVAGFYCKHHPRVHEITIIPRGQAGGYTMYLPEKDRSYVTKGEMFEEEFIRSFLNAAKELAAAGRRAIDRPGMYVMLKRSYAIPVLFLTRHCMELAIKRVIRKCGVEPKREHSLTKLWSSLLSRFPGQRCREDNRAIKNMGAFVEAVADIDDNGISLRYPQDLSLIHI